VTISPCARWNPKGITVLGTGVPGDAPTQLSIPKGIFILQRTNTLYVADLNNDRVQMFLLNKPSRPATSVVSNVRSPSKVYVDDDKNGPTIYISVFIGNRVEKWIPGASQGIQLGGECRSCFGIAVDKQKNVYMSEADRHRVLKWSPVTNLTTIVAGHTDERGTTDADLSAPNGLYFDQSRNILYVADSGNNRIEKWGKDASSGREVAGSNTSAPGGDVGSLAQPNGVWVDQKTKVIYVADTLNNRITRWLPNASVGEIIAGGKGMIRRFELE
jgi:sugar lactone lactonase YvrE